MKSGHKLLRVSIALMLGGLGAFTLAEIAARSFPEALPEQARLRIHWRELLSGETHSVAHGYCGFTYRPSTRGEMSRSDFHFTYGTDSHGFRNEDPWPATADIVAVGDSMTFGYGVEDDETWTANVDAALPDRRIVNLALPGAGPEQYLRYYETFGVALQPSLLLVGILPANDVRDAQRFDDWLAADSPGNYDVWRFSTGGGRLSAFLHRSYVYTALEEAVKSWRSQGFFENQTLELSGGGKLSLVPSLVASGSRDSVRGNPRFAAVLSSLERIRTLAAGNGTEVLFILFPSKEEVYLPMIDAETPEPLRAFRDEFVERGWDHLDLSDAFQRGARRGEQLFFEVDGHPNLAGYAVVAEAVLEHLKSSQSE